ncbi:hypothetical protein EVAR_67983_1 [Eumeta japonica]|uniref:Uncharacterized protein n=1 Tax=Eumeta variegata TaxID=151549 RepID=A0A4C1ZRX5_EUMVA|nr:hypothetical protein EVAR_67983_1 [Eumeta japonica]
MTSQTTLIASPSAAGRHMRVPTARDMLRTTPGGSRLGIGCRRKPSRVGSLPSCPAGGGGWDAAVDSQRAGVNWDGSRESKNRFDASFIYLEMVGFKSMEN